MDTEPGAERGRKGGARTMMLSMRLEDATGKIEVAPGEMQLPMRLATARTTQRHGQWHGTVTEAFKLRRSCVEAKASLRRELQHEEVGVEKKVWSRGVAPASATRNRR